MMIVLAETKLVSVKPSRAWHSVTLVDPTTNPNVPRHYLEIRRTPLLLHYNRIVN